MSDIQQKLFAVLQQNAGNRLTPELINGLVARLAAIMAEPQKDD